MITKRAKEIFNYIQEFISTNGHAPTSAEIALGIGINSRGVVHRYLRNLENENLIRLTPGHKRNIQLISAKSKNQQLPIVGKIAAGKPIMAIEHTTQFDFTELCNPQRFILKVSGDSMIGDNICDGDLIICESRHSAQPHEIAVVLINGEEASLKRIRINSDNTITLIPSNPNMQAMIYHAQQITIQGIYLGLIRINN